MFPEDEPLHSDPNPTTPLPDPSAPPPVQRNQVWIAAGILLFCLLTAIGNWIYGIRQKPEEPHETGAFAKNLFQEQPDLGVILVEGMIVHQSGGGGLSSGNKASSDRIIAAIRQAEKDKVKGLLFKINSPGGTAAASQAVYAEVQRARKEHNIKVVAAMGDMAASGGYYIASAADKIYANPATLTGSIGVIAQFTKVKGLFQKLGLEATVIKSGTYKDIGSPYRDTTPAEREIFQKVIDDTYQDFVNAVATGRKLDPAQVRKLADGRIYTGNQAKAHKLVDELGDYQVAMQALKKMTQTGDMAKVKDYSKANFGEIFEMLGAKMEKLSPTSSLEQLTYAEMQHLNKVPLMLYY